VPLCQSEKIKTCLLQRMSTKRNKKKEQTKKRRVEKLTHQILKLPNEMILAIFNFMPYKAREISKFWKKYFDGVTAKARFRKIYDFDFALKEYLMQLIQVNHLHHFEEILNIRTILTYDIPKPLRLSLSYTTCLQFLAYAVLHSQNIALFLVRYMGSPNYSLTTRIWNNMDVKMMDDPEELKKKCSVEKNWTELSLDRVVIVMFDNSAYVGQRN
jgi:hypothetical protein